MLERALYHLVIAPLKPFPGSETYWNRRYDSGLDSGSGSHGRMAEFKAEILNQFVRDNRIESIIEYGCGDGRQLQLAEYPSYIGFDVSPNAIERCRALFGQDETKRFTLLAEYAGETAELTMSLDVIYHLVEDDVFDAHMSLLFDSSSRFVIVYSSNFDETSRFPGPHVWHRQFSRWVEMNRPQWKFGYQIPNRYPYDGDQYKGSLADFYIYERA